MKTESKFAKLCDIMDTLLGPNGCPWDQVQTLESLRQHVLEETSELIDAMHAMDVEGIKEELGDVLFNMVFLAKVASIEGHFTLDDSLQTIADKLIRRHPHVFGEGKKLESADQVFQQWQEIKKKEKIPQKSALDSIPKSLPALERARHLIKKMKKAGFTNVSQKSQTEEERVGQELFDAVLKAEMQGVSAELALRKVCLAQEALFRSWEQQK